jgi:mono/diheme cytochrome c family protein
MLRITSAIVAALLVAGCGGSGSDTEKEAGAASPPSQGTSSAALSPGGDRGVGPVEHVDVAGLDMSRADEGAEIFQAKCSACHKIDERYIGPALSGVTDRRKPEWIMNMILNPDVMVKEDPTAKGLLAEYLAPMTNQNLTQEQAEAILTWFLQNDGGQQAAGKSN